MVLVLLPATTGLLYRSIIALPIYASPFLPFDKIINWFIALTRLSERAGGIPAQPAGSQSLWSFLGGPL